MGMTDYEKAVALMQRFKEHADPGDLESGGCQEELIRHAEGRLGVTFPPTYRRFLTECGTVGFLSTEFYGIVPYNPDAEAVPNTVFPTMRLRLEASLPNHYMRVAALGNGDEYVLDTRGAPEVEGPVVLWSLNDAKGEFIVPIASDYGAFLLERVEAVIRRS